MSTTEMQGSENVEEPSTETPSTSTLEAVTVTGAADGHTEAGGAGSDVSSANGTGGADHAGTKPRAMRADAKRNYDNLLAAARDEFASCGAATSLEKIAKRAGVGIGTLYRNFPTRQDLLEAVYRDEVDQVCISAQELADAEPWQAFETWTHRLVSYLATKQALASQLLEYLGHDSAVFSGCRASLFEAGDPLVKRAQAAGVLRSDIDLAQVVQLVGGIAKIQVEPERREHFVAITLDGLRVNA